MKYFLDTNSLLDDAEDYYSGNVPFMISSETLIELENIKTNRNKTEDVKAAAHRATKWLIKHHGEYDVIIYRTDYDRIAERFGLDPSSPDVRICCSLYAWKEIYEEDVVFVTHDLECRNIAEKIFEFNVEWFEGKEEEISYSGFKEIVMPDDDMAYFYENQNDNKYDLLINEYLIIKNISNDIVDTYRWDGVKFQPIYKKPVKSTYFDKLKPKDIYQSCVIDSIMNNTITAISAPPGAGKSLLSLMCAMNLIENGKYDRLVILYNATKTKGAFEMGYYSGNAVEKGMQQFIGQMLSTKFGDQFGVELLIQQGKIKIVSLADCRGMEVRDNEILYMTECQNTTIDLMKIALSRVSSGAKVIIEGDYKTQVDSHLFEGNNNGLRRVIEAFKGNSEFGYIELQNIWRSKLAQLAELL